MLLPGTVLWSLRIAVVVGTADWLVPDAGPDCDYPDCPRLELTGKYVLP